MCTDIGLHADAGTGCSWQTSALVGLALAVESLAVPCRAAFISRLELLSTDVNILHDVESARHDESETIQIV